MSTTITLKYFGMPGEGATVKEAKADAGRKIEDYLTNGPRPHLIGHPKMPERVLVWREENGWMYHFLPVTGAIRPLHLWGVTQLGSSYTEKTALAAAVRHLAGLTDDPAIASDLLPDEKEWQDWRYAQAFQVAYRAATGTDNERHEKAWQTRRDFLAQVPERPAVEARQKELALAA